MSSVPLGKRESGRLEFKGRDALRNPASIGREVVAMLNADGGEIWIGVTEQDGRAVAIEAVENSEQARSALQDHLIDTIEPTPRSDEVTVQERADERGRPLLCVVVKPKEDRKPYAQRNREGRLFVRRVEDRVRPMSREEIFPFPGAKDELQPVFKSVREERDRYEREFHEGFWLFVKPAPQVALDLQDRKLKQYLSNPASTGNRRHGWTFALSNREPKLEPHRLVSEIEGYRRTEIRQDGSIVFTLPLKGLYWRGGEKEIWPFALLEYPVSVFRLARSVYEGSDGQVVAELALFELRGWILRPYSPNALGYLTELPEPFKEKDLVETPLVFTRDEVAEKPDACAFRLIERVYQSFGYTRDRVPQEFDQRVGRLIIPE